MTRWLNRFGMEADPYNNRGGWWAAPREMNGSEHGQVDPYS